MDPVDVFFSYSHKDEKYRDKLATHLSMLQNQGVIRSWHDRKIGAGEEWAKAIDDNLQAADIILLLISADFLASRYCYEIEMKQAMARHEAGEATVIPIILRPVDWSGAPFGKLQAFPKNAKVVTKWSPQDEAFVDIAQGIRQAAEDMAEVVAKRNHPPQSPYVFQIRSAKAKGGSRPAAEFDPNEDFHVVLPDEGRCKSEIHKPGALIRIKSPNNMGKTVLMNRVLEYGSGLGWRVASLNLEQTNRKFFDDIDLFMQWFCASVGRQLGVRVNVRELWDDIFGANDNCTDYFENYLLKDDRSPIVLAIDNFDRVFAYPDIETDFCGLLRGWHERSKSHSEWEQLRLVIVHSQEPLAQRDINQSPFNVGMPVELQEFTPDQVADLVGRHGLGWSEAETQQLIELVGGHPYLVRTALAKVASGDLTLGELLETAPTEAGIFSGHLLGHLRTLEDYPELGAAMRLVLRSRDPVRLKSEESFRL
ncbi:MAG: AAA-like domain-containing protein [Cyanobacteria bacterium P01_F01_bin.150]